MGYETEQEPLISQITHTVCNFAFAGTLKGCFFVQRKQNLWPVMLVNIWPGICIWYHGNQGFSMCWLWKEGMCLGITGI